MWRRLIEATPEGHQPRKRLRGRDRADGRRRHPSRHGVRHRHAPIPFRALEANAVAERVVRSVRAECPEHPLILDGRRPGVVLAERVADDDADRPHRSPAAAARPAGRGPATSGAVRSRAVAGGRGRAPSRLPTGRLRRIAFSHPAVASGASSFLARRGERAYDARGPAP